MDILLGKRILAGFFNRPVPARIIEVCEPTRIAHIVIKVYMGHQYTSSETPSFSDVATHCMMTILDDRPGMEKVQIPKNIYLLIPHNN